MSEYWKSTPSFWCKYCATFVRNSKLEIANHNGTPRHQGNIKRFLRTLHRNNEASEKNKELAKSEVARLDRMVSHTKSEEAKSISADPRRDSESKTKMTESLKQKNLLKLAEMGIEIPSEARPALAIAGEWKVVSERIIDMDKQGTNTDSIAIGIHKRKPTAEEEEEEDKEILETRKIRWGTSYKIASQDDDDDLENLLSKSDFKCSKKTFKNEVKEEKQQSEHAEGVSIERSASDATNPAPIKIEPLDNYSTLSEKLEDGKPNKSDMPSVIFKKRKVKNLRQK